MGEPCTQDAGAGAREAAIYCGTWTQPAAHSTGGDLAPPGGLAALVADSPWRSGLDRRLSCVQNPTPVTVLGEPALLLQCERRIGGWPQVALATVLDGHAWYADGVQPSLPVMERSIGVLSGRLSGNAIAQHPVSAGLAAQRLAGSNFSAGDVGQYEYSMRTAAMANRAGSYADAEQAYQSVAALQRRVLPPDSPALSRTLASEAVQASNLGRYGEADRLLAEADRLAIAPGQPDENAAALVLHYTGLNLLNQGRSDEALAMLRRAEAAYTANLKGVSLAGSPTTTVHGGSAAGGNRPGGSRVENAIAINDLLGNATSTAAISGVIETRRAEAVALNRLHRLHESQAEADSARVMAVANGLDAPGTMARLLRTSAFAAEANGDEQLALTRLASSDRDFAASVPGSPAFVQTKLLLARRQKDAGNATAATVDCQAGIAALRLADTGVDPGLLQPCLTLLSQGLASESLAPGGSATGGSAAQSSPAQVGAGSEADAARAGMFEAAQLAQGSITSAQIAEASARLSENARDPRVAILIRERSDLMARLSDLAGQRQERANAARSRAALGGSPAVDAGAGSAAAGEAGPGGTGFGINTGLGSSIGLVGSGGLDAAIAKLRADLAEKDSALQAASPNYGSLVQRVVSAKAVLAALRPHEAFCSIMLAPDGGWSFLLRDGHVFMAPITGGTPRMAALVTRIRASLDTDQPTPPPFDTAAAAELYTAIFGSFGAQMQGVTALTVAPTGPLLSIPFGLLLTGPADPNALAEAPWLVQRLVIAHVPAPVNFVTLRKLAGTSRATSPWFGFGDFQHVTLAQATASFPPSSCGDSARLLAGLPPLPGAITELNAVRSISRAPAGAELLGRAFTAQAVLHADLKHTRILHFATHALLSTDLKCQSEPALVTSAPAGAADASGALLTASEVTRLDLDADAVILSACNTGGAAGGAAGESLSGLARSFFYAGTRSLLVTHWDVNDRVTAYLVALTVAKARGDASLGMAGGLAAAQRSMLADAKGAVAGQAHPYYWAPLALIGDGEAPGMQTQARL